MLMESRLIASGNGWRADDIVCAAGPSDRPFEESHDGVCVAVVRNGTFQYRAAQGAAVLAPGSVLLGNHGTCYQCGHDHSAGDRCLSFHFSPELFEDIVRGVPGVRRLEFLRAALPPLRALARLVAELDSISPSQDYEYTEELVLQFAGVVASMASESPHGAPTVSRRDEKRISDALRYIEVAAQERLTLYDLATAAGVSRFHFLRSFRQIVGLSPYQFVLRMRLHRAAVRIRQSDERISAIVFESGFEDLSTFNRRFRAMFGMTPGAFRAAGNRRSIEESAV